MIRTKHRFPFILLFSDSITIYNASKYAVHGYDRIKNIYPTLEV